MADSKRLTAIILHGHPEAVRLMARQHLGDLQKGYPLRDESAFKDLPASVKEGATDVAPRITDQPPATQKGGKTKVGKFINKGIAKLIDTIIEAPGLQTRVGTITDQSLSPDANADEGKK
jgi:hypothetical protein